VSARADRLARTSVRGQGVETGSGRNPEAPARSGSCADHALRRVLGFFQPNRGVELQFSSVWPHPELDGRPRRLDIVDGHLTGHPFAPAIHWRAQGPEQTGHEHGPIFNSGTDCPRGSPAKPRGRTLRRGPRARGVGGIDSSAYVSLRCSSLGFSRQVQTGDGFAHRIRRASKIS